MKLLATAAVCFALLASSASADPPTEGTPPPLMWPTPAPIVVSTYQGHSAEWWAARSRSWHTRALSLHRTLIHDSTVTDAINLACVVYGYCSTLWSKARCETGGTFSPYAANRHSSARGLFQFLTEPRGGTWATTPYARFSVFDPFANALAAGWMHAHGRGGEWVCR